MTNDVTTETPTAEDLTLTTPPAQKRRRGNGQTSRESLSSIIKSVRNLLRQDSGLDGDATRLPQLTWLLFLKFLDDHERAMEEYYGEEYTPIVEAPYRWRDWAGAGKTTGRQTGDELVAFVNEKLIPYLGLIAGTTDQDTRNIVGAIFRSTRNLIRSGYVMRQVVDKLSQIDFNVRDDIHTVSHFYETMLKEMRDASGQSGEFYTPRPVVRFIIDRLQPRLGERILDPACGTGGFLVEAY